MCGSVRQAHQPMPYKRENDAAPMTVLLTAFHIAMPSVADKRNQRRSTPIMVRGADSAGYAAHARAPWPMVMKTTTSGSSRRPWPFPSRR